MKPLRLIIFRGRLGWYWRLVSGNNRVVAIGGEPFATAGGARRGFEGGVYDSLYARAWRVDVEAQLPRRRR